MSKELLSDVKWERDVYQRALKSIACYHDNPEENPDCCDGCVAQVALEKVRAHRKVSHAKSVAFE